MGCSSSTNTIENSMNAFSQWYVNELVKLEKIPLISKIQTFSHLLLYLIPDKENHYNCETSYYLSRWYDRDGPGTIEYGYFGKDHAFQYYDKKQKLFLMNS